MLVSLFISSILCDCPTLGNCQTRKLLITNLLILKLLRRQDRQLYVQNCKYDNLLTYYATSGLIKNNNEIVCQYGQWMAA